MRAARHKAILVGRVSDQDRSTVRGRVTVLTSDRLDLIRPNILRLPGLRYGDAIFRVVAAITIDCSDRKLFLTGGEKRCGLIEWEINKINFKW